MRVAVIGGGIAGLSAATFLSCYPGIRVTVLERAGHIGGRADMVEDAEHCQRLFIDDYIQLFDILRQIPVGGGTVYESLRPVSRMVRIGGHWRQISRLYAIWSRELTVWEKYRVINERRTSALLADRVNSYRKTLRMLRNFDIGSLISFVTSSKRSQLVVCLPGRTDECLITPWVEFLAERGVEFRPNTNVRTVTRARTHSAPRYWNIRTDTGTEAFDAVITTALPGDLARLLDASGLAHRLPRHHEHLNFKVLTFEYADREPGVDFPDYALMAHNGVSILLQRPAGRCTAFCTSPLDASDEHIRTRVEEMLGEMGAVSFVGVRPNSTPAEAIYCAKPVDPKRVLVRHRDGLYFAGSAMEQVYPFDSGEAATRSARAAVDQLLIDTSSRTVGFRVPGPFTGTRFGMTLRHVRKRRCDSRDCPRCYEPREK